MKDDKSKPAAAQAGFVKMTRSDDIIELIQEWPLAFALAAVIALRARYRPGKSLKGLQPGEAFIGDHQQCGMSEQQYRTCKEKLAQWGFAMFKPTNKGTVAKLTDTRLFDVLSESSQRTANGQLTDSQRLTKKGKKEKKVEDGLRPANFSNWRVPFPSRFPQSVQQVYEYGCQNGCDESLCKRWIRYNNTCGWQQGGEPMAYWPKSLLVFRDSCNDSSHGADDVPYGWIPEIVPPDDEPASPVRKPRAKPAVTLPAEPAPALPPPPAARPAPAPAPAPALPAPAAKPASSAPCSPERMAEYHDALHAAVAEMRPAPVPYREPQPVADDIIPDDLEQTNTTL
jgi:hypothetical protein